MFTIVIFTENKIGLLNRITTLFTQRHINIESITASESEYTGIHRFTIVIEETEEKTLKVVKQIEKQVEVLKAFCFKEEETIHSEIALYKIRKTPETDYKKLEQILKQYKAVVTERTDTFLVIEKTGHKSDTHNLFEELKPFDIQGFARSGRVSLSRQLNTFTAHLKALEAVSKTE